MMEISDEAVEAACRAQHLGWLALSPHAKQWHRDAMREVLRSALGVLSPQTNTDDADISDLMSVSPATPGRDSQVRCRRCGEVARGYWVFDGPDKVGFYCGPHLVDVVQSIVAASSSVVPQTISDDEDAIDRAADAMRVMARYNDEWTWIGMARAALAAAVSVEAGQ